MSNGKGGGFLGSLLKWAGIALFVVVMIWVQSFLRKAPESAPDRSGDGAGGDAGLPVKVLDLTAGDVEAKTTITGTVPATSRTPNMKVDEMINPKKEVDMVTVDVSQPFPTELPLQFKVGAFLDLGQRSVVLRGQICVDNKPVQPVEAVWTGPKPVYPEFVFNGLQGLTQPPATMLVHLRAEVLLLPAGTDPATVKIADLKVADEAMGTLMSNPIRINFKQ